MPYSVRILRLLERVDPALREVLLAILEEIERQREESVTKKEFNELKEIVREIGKEVKQLAEAQKKTEEELGKLSEAQKKTEEKVQSLTEEVRKLSEAQKKTEEKVQSLTEEVRRLSETQKKTEEEVRRLSEGLQKLTEEHRKTREQLGSLQHTVGYLLEDRAYRGLPPLLERDFGLRLLSPPRRRYLEVSPGRYLEVNILGEAMREGEKVFIVGECKSQLKKKDVEAFLRNLSRIQKLLQGEILPILVTYQTSPLVERYVEEKGLKLYFSFEFPL